MFLVDHLSGGLTWQYNFTRPLLLSCSTFSAVGRGDVQPLRLLEDRKRHVWYLAMQLYLQVILFLGHYTGGHCYIRKQAVGARCNFCFPPFSNSRSLPEVYGTFSISIGYIRVVN